MATTATASCIIPLPVERVWTLLRDFTFIQRVLSTIQSVEIEDNKSPFEIGCVRKVTWKTGEYRRHRLLDLSDYIRCVCWELIEANPEIESHAVITTVRCRSVTERNQTFVEWSSDFSSGVSAEFVLFEGRAYQENLAEIRHHLTGRSLPVLHHVHEGPSCRVLWLAYEIGIPICAKESCPSSGCAENETPTIPVTPQQGGLLCSYNEEDLDMIESGAIISYLLEKHDYGNILSPEIGSKERAKFHQIMFFTVATVDYILVDVYKQMFVYAPEERSDDALEAKKKEFNTVVPPILLKHLANSRYICGDNFTAADIAIGWSLNFASMLGLLDNQPKLGEYLTRLRARPHFKTAFGLHSSAYF